MAPKVLTGIDVEAVETILRKRVGARIKNRRLYHQWWFWAVVATVSVTVIGFRTYVVYMEAHSRHLQVGRSLYPIVADYFSWSEEVSLGPEELPAIGEFYTYKRPEPDYSKMTFWRRVVVWLYNIFSGGRMATKQCQDILAKEKKWDTGSDDGVMPFSAIVGHVTEIRDSRYRKLSKTPEGRLRLWVERHHLRGDYTWFGPGDVAVGTTDGTDIYIQTVLCLHIEHYKPNGDTRDGKIPLIWRVDKWFSRYASYDIASQVVSYPADSGVRHMGNMVVHGACWRALDGDPATSWDVGPADGRETSGLIEFDRPIDVDSVDVGLASEVSMELTIKAGTKVVSIPSPGHYRMGWKGVTELLLIVERREIGIMPIMISEISISLH